MRSCLSSSSGLPNYQFHQIQDVFKKLGKYSFAQIGSCALASACQQLPATAFWGKDSKHQRISSSYGSILHGLAGKRSQGSDFFWRLPDAKHWAVHVGTLEFQYHLSTLWYETSFCQPFRQGSKLVNWEISTLGWPEHLRNGAKTWGRWEISHRAATKSACVSDQTNWFIFVKKCGPESQ